MDTCVSMKFRIGLKNNVFHNSRDRLAKTKFLSFIMLNSSSTGSKMFRERNDKLAAICVLIYVSTWFV